MRLFKKREEAVLDLRTKSRAIPVSREVKRKFSETESIEVQEVSSSQEAEPAQNSGGSFFGGFFGGSSQTSSTSTTTKTPSTSTTTSSSSSYSPYGSSTPTKKVSAKDILEKISRLTDRVELIEQKITRLERR